jgi:adenine-specific DNA-methyltransferase
MPSLDFKGKSFIYTHHLSVPYRELLIVPEKSCPASGRQPDLDDNLILHGDNLQALKALLPRYAGKVDCIFIDPPYNTGSEGWCYNDAVNAPLMREWLKKEGNPVEREDLQRHDKWLCMMWPRLQLLNELLSENGVIFITIDQNEQHHLRLLLDEIFKEECFVASIAWQKRTSPESRKRLGPAFDTIHVYSKNPNQASLAKLQLTDEQIGEFANPDNDPKGEWTSTDLTAQNPDPTKRIDQQYRIQLPSGEWVSPPPGRCWGMLEGEYLKKKTEGRIWFGKDGNARPRIKTYLSESEGVSSWTWWPNEDAGHNQEAKKELLQILGPTNSFDYPKPVRLLTKILELSSRKDSIILDSFAGSGTTAHAVLAMNAKDKGNRKFILCETEAYADALTAERVRRVICGYDYVGTQETELHPPEKVTWTTFAKDGKRNALLDHITSIENLEAGNYDKIEKKISDGVLTVVGQRQVKEKMPGLGGSFTYVELGEAMDLDRLLAETPGTLPSFLALARYLFFTATGQTLAAVATPVKSKPAASVKGKAKAKPALETPLTDAPLLIGETSVWRIYLHYRPDEAWLRSPAAAFTRTQAEAIADACEGTGKQALVFAAAKFINHRSLRDLKVDFAQLPYALHRVQAE